MKVYGEELVWYEDSVQYGEPEKKVKGQKKESKSKEENPTPYIQTLKRKKVKFGVHEIKR